MYRRVLWIQNQTLGSEHEKTLATVVVLGLLYAKQGKIAMARKMYRSALHGFEKEYGKGSMLRWPLHTAKELVELCCQQSEPSRYREGEAMYQRLIDANQTVWGAKHKVTLTRMSEFATFYKQQGKLVEAEMMFHRVLQGVDDTIDTTNRLAQFAVRQLHILYHQQCNFGKAEKMGQRILRWMEEAYDVEHTLTLKSVKNLGITYWKEGKLEEAEMMYERTLLGLDKVQCIESSSTLSTVAELGSLCYKQGKLEKAGIMWRRALLGYEKTLGSNHKLTVTIACRLENVCKKQDGLADVPLLDKFLKVRQLESNTINTSEDIAIRPRKSITVAKPERTSPYEQNLNVYRQRISGANVQYAHALRYKKKYCISNDPKDITTAIRLMREAIGAVSPRYHKYIDWSMELLTHLKARSLKTGILADLIDVIQVIRDILEATPEEDGRRANRLYSLGKAIGERFNKTGNLTDLEESIQFLREAAYSISEIHPDRTAWLLVLRHLIEAKYSRTGASAELDEAIRVQRELLDATQRDSSDQATALAALGRLLHNRYQQTAVLADLEESTRLGREALVMSSGDHPRRQFMLRSLGTCFMTKYRRTGTIADLNESNRIRHEVLNKAPEDHRDRADWLSKLGLEQYRKYETTGALTDLEESLQLEKKAIVEMKQDHSGRTALLQQHGEHLYAKYLRTKAMSDLEEVIGLARECINTTPDGHGQRAQQFYKLGRGLKQKYLLMKNMLDLESAIMYFQSALHQSNSRPTLRISAGRNVVSCCSINSDWQQAYQASAYTIQLIPQLMKRSLTNMDKQHVLREIVGLASDAVAFSCNVEQSPLTALSLLERGRGILAVSLEDMRVDIEELKGRSGNVLATEYDRLRNVLEVRNTHDTLSGEEIRENSSQLQIDHRYDAEKQFDKLLKRIRRIYPSFLRSPNKEQMQKAASDGPIVAINVSEYRCDAIIIEHNQIAMLALPDLKAKEIEEKAQGDTLKEIGVLEWLWDVVAKPILDALGFTKRPLNESWPHVWWIPTGPLSKFPIHAAGRHTEHSDDTVIDRVMSSYSSTVKAIIYGRRRPAYSPSATDKALLVAMKDTPGQNELHFACDEIKSLSSLCRSMAIEPISPVRRKQDILSYLNKCKIFYFAGHGHTDIADPSQSYLLLEDWKEDRLTVSTLLDMNLRSHSPFLAYLSACGTGQLKNERFFDENIHLITAYQLAGFRHVIGTLWEVNDQSCVDVATVTYEEMGDGGMTDESVCLGLHKATRKLRDSWLNVRAKLRHERRYRRAKAQRDLVLDDDEDDDEIETGPLHWVPYVHFGV